MEADCWWRAGEKGMGVWVGFGWVGEIGLKGTLC